MDTLTLFRAYVKARDRCDSCRTARGRSTGIACDDDHWARQYQRYARLAWKLHLYICRRLGSDMGNLCWFCGGRDDFHYSWCKDAGGDE